MEINRYKQIRSIYSKLVYEIINSDCNSRENIIASGKNLDFWNGESMIFEDEEESNVLTEYNLYEYRIKDKE